MSVSDLEKALWADLEENQILKEFSPPTPAELLRQYNISLTQTLLFRAMDLDIWITGSFQRVLWKILRSGLMYSLEDTQEKEGKNRESERTDETKETERLKSVHLHLDGPASLFRMSERYGNSFAKLFPILLKSKGWKLKAGILYKGYQGKRVLEFALDSSEEAFRFIPEAASYPQRVSPDFQLAEDKEGYGIKTGADVEDETEFIEKETETQEAGIDTENEAYDSTYEQQFANLSFGGWEAKREPTILKAGRFAFVPDFSLQKNGIKVYAEIVGFWTPDYLKKKIEKLKDVKEPVILLINRKLKCSEKDFPAQDVIFFTGRFLQTRLHRYLESMRKKGLQKTDPG
ncbi:DUF790 family protein [Methanosarcina horonobensis]|uniref:DUF790 family protein n=1 Tax=Methanosarcina horonobensis TaxID=418008 RepID=UPI0022B8A0FA|nr:DUF790 family protein [Methanosarcina horonobensis]